MLMHRQRPACRWTGWLVLVALALVVGRAPAQQGGDAPPPPPAPEAAPEKPPTIDDLQKQIDRIKSEQGLEDKTRQDIIGVYQQAIEQLRQAEQWRTKRAEFERLSAQAPDQLASIQSELAKPPPPVSIQPPENATVAQLEQSQAQAQGELDAARQKAADLAQEPQNRESRRQTIPAQIAQLRSGLAETEAELKAAPVPNVPPEMAAARHALLRATAEAQSDQIKALQAEVASYDARQQLLPARRDRAQREVSQAEKKVQAWQQAVIDARNRQAEQAAREAKRLAREAAGKMEPIRRLADENQKLAAQLPAARKDQSRAEIEQQDIERRLSEFEARTQDVEQKVDEFKLTKAIGLLLRKEYENLPDVAQLRSQSRVRQAQISQLEIELYELEDQRDRLGQISELVDELLQSIPAGQRPSDDTELRSLATELYTQRRDNLNALIAAKNAYSRSLYNIDSTARTLIDRTDAYRRYIEERILWVRSVVGSRVPGVKDTLDAVRWLVSPQAWTDAAAATWREASDRWPILSVWIIGLLLSILSRPWCRREIVSRAKLVSRYRTDAMRFTVEVLLLTPIIALPIPLLLWLAAWLLSIPPDQPGVALAAADGLGAAAAFYLVLSIFRQVVRQNGLAEAHFRWPAPALRLVRRHLRWLTPVSIPVVFLVASMAGRGSDAANDSLGRIAFMVGMVLLAVFDQRIFKPSGAIMSEFFRRNRGGWIDRLKVLWYPLVVGLPLLFAAVAAAGYYYTALQLEQRLNLSLALVAALVLVNALLLRWLFIARRRLAVEKARQQREAPAEGAKPRDSAEADEDDSIDIPAVNAQTRQLIRMSMALALVLGLYGVWVNVLPALRMLDRVEIWPRLRYVQTTSASATSLRAVQSKPTEKQPGTPAANKAPTAGMPSPSPSLSPPVSPTPSQAPSIEQTLRVRVTLADLGLALVILMLTYVGTRNFPGLLEIAFLQRLPLDAGSRYAITTVARYTVMIVGLTAAFGAVGIGWAKVQWLAAALTFGLAFGLQEIFANFVSGLIILIERPVRIGDTVTVGGITGTVSRIRMRATTIIDWDRKELVVPNKSFITDQVINWTLSDPILRVTVAVGVAYGSDTDMTRRLLLKVADEHPLVLRDPEPRALFLGFGDNSLNFELRVHIPHIDHLLTVKDAMHFEIDNAFRKAGIEIAFPQRDLHVRAGEPLQVVLRGDSVPQPPS